MTTTFDNVKVKLHYVVSMMLGRGVGNIEMVMPRPSPATLPGLLAALADEFGEMFIAKVYNPNTAVFNPGLSIAMNRGLIDPRQIPKIELADNAEIFIFPVYKGG